MADRVKAGGWLRLRGGGVGGGRGRVKGGGIGGGGVARWL